MIQGHEDGWRRWYRQSRLMNIRDNTDDLARSVGKQAVHCAVDRDIAAQRRIPGPPLPRQCLVHHGHGRIVAEIAGGERPSAGDWNSHSPEIIRTYNAIFRVNGFPGRSSGMQDKVQSSLER